MFPIPIPEEAVAAARKVIAEEAELPHMARARDYVDEHSVGNARARQLAALRRADADADAANGVFVRKVIEAALPFLQFSPVGDNHHNAAACPYCMPEGS